MKNLFFISAALIAAQGLACPPPPPHFSVFNDHVSVIETNEPESNGLIRLTPKDGQGYLVLNRTDNREVNRWEITLSYRIPQPESEPLIKVMEQVTLKGDLNFWRVPPRYLAGEITVAIEVYGIDENGLEIAHEGPVIIYDNPSVNIGDEHAYVPQCNWVCNGQSYAYKIQQYVQSGQLDFGPSRLIVEPHEQFDEATQTSTPFYYYVTEEQYNSACPNGIGTIGNGIQCADPTGVWVTNLRLITEQNYNSIRDINGWPMPLGTYVVGIGKNMGPWRGGNLISTGELSFGNTVCPNSRVWAIDQVNLWGDFTIGGSSSATYPPLTCNAIVSSQVEPSRRDWKWITRLDTLFKKHKQLRIDTFDVFNYVHDISVFNLNNPSGGPLVINPDVLTNGDPIALGPGLYNFGLYRFEDGYIPHIIELEDSLSFQLAMKHFLNVVIYPVPIEYDYFTVFMTALEDLQFTYELLDHNANKIHADSFSLKKGQEWKHIVRPLLAIPSGNYINRFVFEDGSVKVIHSVK